LRYEHDNNSGLRGRVRHTAGRQWVARARTHAPRAHTHAPRAHTHAPRAHAHTRTLSYTHTYIYIYIRLLTPKKRPKFESYREIGLVPDEHDRHVRVGVLPRVLQPAGEVVERLPPGKRRSGGGGGVGEVGRGGARWAPLERPSAAADGWCAAPCRGAYFSRQNCPWCKGRRAAFAFPCGCCGCGCC
jgi:hypothetical protein